MPNPPVDLDPDPDPMLLWEADQWARDADHDTYPGPRVRCQCGLWFNARGMQLRCRPCREACPHLRCLPGRIVYTSGRYHPAAWCPHCGAELKLGKGAGPGLLVIRDCRITRGRAPVPCLRCGATDGTERHHFAPTAIFGFGEAERWPTGNLCPKCHAVWHRAMRRAGGFRRLTVAERAAAGIDVTTPDIWGHVETDDSVETDDHADIA